MQQHNSWGVGGEHSEHRPIGDSRVGLRWEAGRVTKGCLHTAGAVLSYVLLAVAKHATARTHAERSAQQSCSLA